MGWMDDQFSKIRKMGPLEVVICFVGPPLVGLILMSTMIATRWDSELTFLQGLGVATAVGLVYLVLAYVALRLIRRLRQK